MDGLAVHSLYYAYTPMTDISRLRLFNKAVIVEPLYDPDKIGSIYLAQTAQNPQSQQGIVVQSAPDSDFVPSDYLLYRQWQGKPLRLNDHEFLYITDEHILCRYDKIDHRLIPRKNQVVIIPDRPTVGAVKQGSLIVLERIFDSPPIRYGTIIAAGDDCTEVQVNARVIIPDHGGYELGIIDTVYYLIEESFLLATMEPSDAASRAE